MRTQYILKKISFYSFLYFFIIYLILYFHWHPGFGIPVLSTFKTLALAVVPNFYAACFSIYASANFLYLYETEKTLKAFWERSHLLNKYLKK